MAPVNIFIKLVTSAQEILMMSSFMEDEFMVMFALFGKDSFINSKSMIKFFHV